MLLIHVTTVHTRYDSRIFFRECLLLSKEVKTILLVCDDKNNEINEKLQIINVSDSKNRFIKIFRMIKFIINLKNKKNVVLHLHDPELFFFVLLFKISGFKVVLDIHEDYSKQIILKKYLPLPTRKFISIVYKLFEFIITRFSDFNVVPTPSFLSKHNTVLVGNFLKKSEIISLNELNESKNNNKTFIYAGSISEERGIYNIIKFAKYISNYGYKVKVAGNFNNSQLKIDVFTHPDWYYIEYLGVLDKESLFNEQLNSFAGLILFNNIGQYNLSYSLKLFEYVACGLPVLLPDFGEWLDVNDRYNIGINVDVNNISIEDINNLMSNANKSESRKVFLDDFNLDDNIYFLLKKYKELF